MFISERGAPMSPVGFRRMLGRLGKAAKMAFGVHPHMLRHACGFKLLNQGVDTRSLQHLPRPQKYPAHRARHRAFAGQVPRLLEGLIDALRASWAVLWPRQVLSPAPTPSPSPGRLLTARSNRATVVSAPSHGRGIWQSLHDGNCWRRLPARRDGRLRRGGSSQRCPHRSFEPN